MRTNLAEIPELQYSDPTILLYNLFNDSAGSIVLFLNNDRPLLLTQLKNNKYYYKGRADLIFSG